MKCKKHLTDFSSVVGVCASCLRDRLFFLIAAQEQAHAAAAAAAAAAEDDRRKSDNTIPPPLIFPRSVSPYISRRKSDTNPSVWDDPGRPDRRRFYSTPQVGPSGGLIAAGACGRTTSKKKSGIRFSFFGYFFRSKSDRNSDLDPGPGPVLHTAESCEWPAASPAWYSVFSSRRKKQSRTFSLEEPVASGVGQRRICRNPERGMSPARFSDAEDEHCSGYSSESSQPWKQTPRSTPAGKRGGGGRNAAAHSRNVSGMNFCLSPLVRASPGRHWSKKGGVPTEMVVPGDIRVVPVKPSLTNATSFCKNRSRKLADFGRFHQNR